MSAKRSFTGATGVSGRASKGSRSRRRYLSGIDWVIHALDWRTRRATGIGNLSQIVLELEEAGHGDRIRSVARDLFSRLPLIHGRAGRDMLNLAPYWRMGDSGLDPVRDAEPNAPGTTAEQLAGLVNTPFRGPRDHVALRVLPGERRGDLVVLTFDHLLLDGRGAELLLGLLDRFAAEGESVLDPQLIRPTAPSGLTDWAAKFKSGQTANRAARALSDARMARLPLPARGARPFRFRIVAFDEEETAAIDRIAQREAGYMMVMPFLLAAAARSLRSAFCAADHEGEFVVAVTSDARGRTPAPGSVFFNHVSFLFFRVPCGDVDDLATISKSVTRQMYDQVCAQHPQHFAEASQLMRILPVSALGGLQEALFRGNTGSFAFSYVGGADISRERFMGVPTRNLVHMPRVAVAPGVGLFFNRFRGRLNATFSYLDGMLPEDVANGVVARLVETLQDGGHDA